MPHEVRLGGHVQGEQPPAARVDGQLEPGRELGVVEGDAAADRAGARSGGGRIPEGLGLAKRLLLGALPRRRARIAVPAGLPDHDRVGPSGDVVGHAVRRLQVVDGVDGVARARGEVLVDDHRAERTEGVVDPRQERRRVGGGPPGGQLEAERGRLRTLGLERDVDRAVERNRRAIAARQAGVGVDAADPDAQAVDALAVGAEHGDAGGDVPPARRDRQPDGDVVVLSREHERVGGRRRGHGGHGQGRPRHGTAAAGR